MKTFSLELRGQRVRVATLGPEAAPRAGDYVRRNRDFHGPWNPRFSERYYSDEFWSDRLAQSLEEAGRGESLRLFVLEADDPKGPIRGHLSFSRIVRGPFQAALLGYAVDQERAGQGYMSEALRLALDYVFAELGLHRVEANYVPTNERSGRLLRRLGFVVQGYARDYLHIDGEWRDHVLTALTNPNPEDPELP